MRVLLFAVGILSVCGFADLCVAASASANFWIDRKITFSNLIEPSRSIRILLEGSAGGIPKDGVYRVTLPEHVEYQSIYVDTAFSVIGNDPAAYEVSEDGQTVSIQIKGKDGKPDRSDFKAWIDVKTAKLDALPETPPTWSMPVSIKGTLKDGSAYQFEGIETGAWLYSRVTLDLVQPVEQAGPDELLRYRVTAAGYPHANLTRSTLSIRHPFGSDIEPGSVSGIPGASSSEDTLNYRYEGGSRSGVSGTFSVRVRDRFNLERAEIEELTASATMTHVVEADYVADPVHVRSDTSPEVTVPVFLPREALVNMWFIEEQERYTAGEPGLVSLNFLLKDEAPITIDLLLPFLTEDERILRVEEEIEIPRSFTLTPDEPQRTFPIPLILMAGGIGEIGANATATEFDGAVLPISATRRIGIEEGLRVSLALTDREGTDELRMGDEFGVRLTVKAPTDGSGLTEVAFADPEGLSLPMPLEIVEAPEDTEIGRLRAGEEFFMEWRLRAAHPGRFVLGHHQVSGITEEGETLLSNQAEISGAVSGFIVEIVYPEEPLEMERQDDNEEPEDGVNGVGYKPLEFDVTVMVSVPEEGETIENVSFQGFDASDGGLDIDLVQATGIESDPWIDVQPQPVPNPVWVSQRSSTGSLKEKLLPGGDPGEFVVTVTAERPGTFDMAALITASPEGGGNTITGRGAKVADIKGDIVLAMQLEVVNQPARITEGQSVEITGVVENVSLTETIRLSPLIVISSGQGVPRGPVALDDPLPLAGSPGIFNPELEPGQSERFRLRVDTLSLPGFDQSELSRQSVIIDFAVSGKIIDIEGEERDLNQESTQVEWGNGRHEVDGAVFLRAEVERDFRPTQVLDPDTFFTVAAGEALENLVRGGGEFVLGIPDLLAGLPPALYGIADLSGKYQVEKQIASHNAARYLWAWMDLQVDIWAHLDTAEREQQLQLISDELAFYYGDKFESAEHVRQLVNQSITGYFTKVVDYQQRAYETSGYGYNVELAQIVGEPFRPIGSFALEEAASAVAVASWVGRTSRSTKISDGVSQEKAAFRAKSAQQADGATAAMVRAGDPRITEMPDPMKALPASTPLTQKHAVDGWGIDPVSDRNLVKMTDVKNGGMPIFVAIRSRADETIEWMTQLGIVPKPMTFKPKNVNADDVAYLGYRDGVGYGDANGVGAGDRGATLLAEPIPRDVVAKRLENVDEVTRKRVLQRHADRWEEWYGHTNFDSRVIDKTESKLWELSNRMSVEEVNGRLVRKGTLDVPRRGSVPQPDINLDTVGPGVLDARQFELRQVKNPPDDDLFDGGRQYFECWLEDDLATSSGPGVMRRIAGDIDTVAVGMADGSALPVANEFSETVARNMLHGVQAQHPWSSSLALDRLFEKFVNNGSHRWHPDPAKRGEPLIIYVNGERRVGWFHPTRAITRENPLKGFMWVDGGTGDVDNVIRFQKDLRGNLANVSKVNPPLVKPITSFLREALIRLGAQSGEDLIATCTIETAKTSGTLYRVSKNTVFQKRNDDGSWSDANPTDGCDDAGVVVLPETFLTGTASPGDVTLKIIDELLDFDWREMFAVGDHVLIDPGTPNEETRRITGHASLILDRPLTLLHAGMARVVSLGPVPDDADADGLSDERESGLGTNPFAADSDGDGLEDATELARGTDPLVSDRVASAPGGELLIHRQPSGEWELSWPETEGALQASPTMVPGSWRQIDGGTAAGGRIRWVIPFQDRRHFYRLHQR